jgi:hypothetical protein
MHDLNAVYRILKNVKILFFHGLLLFYFQKDKGINSVQATYSTVPITVKLPAGYAATEVSNDPTQRVSHFQQIS